MYTFEKFKETKYVLESINADLLNNLFFLAENKLIEKTVKETTVNEAKEATANDWLTNPKGTAKAAIKDIPIIGGLFNAATNGSAEKEAKQASEKWKKAYVAQEGAIMKLYILVDKAKANGKGKDPKDIKDDEAKIKERYKTIIDGANTEWDDAIGEIEDNQNLKDKLTKEKKVIQAQVKAETAEALLRKNKEIAMKHLGYSDEQIDGFKKTAKEGLDDIKDIESKAEETNTDPEKDMAAAQKKKADELKKKYQENGDILATLAEIKQKGGKYRDEQAEEQHKKLGEYQSALTSYISGIGTKADEWDGPNHGKPEGFDELEAEVNQIKSKDKLIVKGEGEGEDNNEKEERIKTAEEEYKKVKNNKPTSKARITAYINLLKAKGGNEDKVKELEDTLKNGKTPEGDELTESLIFLLESILFE